MHDLPENERRRLKALYVQDIAEVHTGVCFLNATAVALPIRKARVAPLQAVRVNARNKRLHMQESGWYRGVSFVPFGIEGFFILYDEPGGRFSHERKAARNHEIGRDTIAIH